MLRSQGFVLCILEPLLCVLGYVVGYQVLVLYVSCVLSRVQQEERDRTKVADAHEERQNGSNPIWVVIYVIFVAKNTKQIGEQAS